MTRRLRDQPRRRPCGCGNSCSARPAPPPCARPPGCGVADALGDGTRTGGGARGRRWTPSPGRCAGCCAPCPATASSPRRPDGTFAHTDMSRLLREDDPHSLRYIALWCTEPWTWDVWPRLDEAVRTGTQRLRGPVRQGVLRLPPRGRPRVGAGLQPGHDDLQRAVGAGRRRPARPHRGVLGRRHRRRPGPRGGEPAGEVPGHAAARCWTCPGGRGAADARLRDGGQLADRDRIVAGDCREAVPVKADVYVIKNILEWDDESTRRTLRNVVAAARPGARVVVIENLVDDTPSMRFTTAMDLLLLLNVGGAKHTRQSLVGRLTEAGLRRRRHPSGQPVPARLRVRRPRLTPGTRRRPAAGPGTPRAGRRRRPSVLSAVSRAPSGRTAAPSRPSGSARSPGRTR